MSIHPHGVKDLMLAPVAAQIDVNLQRVRDRSPDEIEYELQMELDRPPRDDSAADRSSRVLEFALRNVDLHEWEASITGDAARLRLSGGSVSLDLGLGRSVTDFIAGANGRG